jgi:cell division protein FtsL
MSTVRAPARVPPRRIPAAVPREEPRPHLRVVDQQAPRRRPAALVSVLAVMVLFVTLLALVVAHTMLVQGQRRLDTLNRQVAASQQRYGRLRLEVAHLESPEVIVAAAMSRLGMTWPEKTTYLTPSAPAATAGDTTATTVPPTTTGAGGDSSVAAADGEAGWSTVKPYLSENR